MIYRRIEEHKAPILNGNETGNRATFEVEQDDVVLGYVYQRDYPSGAVTYVEDVNGKRLATFSRWLDPEDVSDVFKK